MANEVTKVWCIGGDDNCYGERKLKCYSTYEKARAVFDEELKEYGRLAYFVGKIKKEGYTDYGTYDDEEPGDRHAGCFWIREIEVEQRKDYVHVDVNWTLVYKRRSPFIS